MSILIPRYFTEVKLFSTVPDKYNESVVDALAKGKYSRFLGFRLILFALRQSLTLDKTSSIAYLVLRFLPIGVVIFKPLGQKLMNVIKKLYRYSLIFSRQNIFALLLESPLLLYSLISESFHFFLSMDFHCNRVMLHHIF